MNHPLPTLRAFAAAWLLLTGSALSGAAPAAVTDDEAVATLQTAYARSVVPGEQAEFYRDLLATVLQRIRRSHVTTVDLPALAAVALKSIEPLAAGSAEPAQLFNKAINEALRTLDPYSRYLDARSQVNESGNLGGAFGGLGVELQSDAGALRVVAPMPGGPAARAGLASGDLIVRVDNRSVEGLPLADAIAQLRGQPGTPVSVTIQRAGAANEFTVSITRETIRRPTLRWSMEGEVLVLRLPIFGAAAAASMAKVIADAAAQRPPQAVVLDLRGNPGGLLREAVRVADAFLKEGEIVSLRGSTQDRQRSWLADADELLAGLPMVVLIDRRSASAAELVADALQFSGRATVMGQRSFGKGSVQTIYPLGDQKGALKLTTATYYGPSGQTVQRTGVAPDIELIGVAGAVGARATSDVSQPPGEAPPLRQAKARVEAGRCRAPEPSDPVLSCALAYLRAGSVDSFLARLAH